MASSRKKKLPPWTISIDDREKIPYHFSGSPSRCVRMETGDYGIIEAPLLVTVDRKSMKDAVQTVISSRDRFKREMVRMQEYEFRAIVIEGSLEQMLQPYGWSKSHPRSVVQSYLSLQVAYNVHVVWAGSRTLGRSITFRLLEWAWIHRCRKLGISV